MKNAINTNDYKDFLKNLKKRVEEARFQATRHVNSELILLYYQIGVDILNQQEKLGWGAKIVNKLSSDLSSFFPDMKGFSARNLKYMRLFAETFPNYEFVQQAAAQIPWFHIVVLMEKVKDPEERVFLHSENH